MDPNACLWLFIFARDAAERREAADNYAAWIRRGGFRAVVQFDGKRREVVDLSAPTKRISFLASSVATDRNRCYADLDGHNLKRWPLTEGS